MADDVDDAFSAGEPPAYADVIAATVVGRGKVLQMTITFAEELPARTEEDEELIAALALREPGTEKSRWTFAARSSPLGWDAFKKARDKQRRLEDALSIRDGSVILRLPWTVIGGPRRFEWYANGSWARTGAAVKSFSFDLAPNGDVAAYPSE